MSSKVCRRALAAGVYAAILVGAGALASWNEQFSSSRISYFWKLLSIASAVLPFTSVVAITAPSNTFSYFVCFMLISIHIAVRLCVIVVLFYSFASLPSAVYNTQSWLNFMPFFH